MCVKGRNILFPFARISCLSIRSNVFNVLNKIAIRPDKNLIQSSNGLLFLATSLLQGIRFPNSIRREKRMIRARAHLDTFVTAERNGGSLCLRSTERQREKNEDDREPLTLDVQRVP